MIDLHTFLIVRKPEVPACEAWISDQSPAFPVLVDPKVNGLHCVTDMHGRVYDWDDFEDVGASWLST